MSEGRCQRTEGRCQKTEIFDCVFQVKPRLRRYSQLSKIKLQMIAADRFARMRVRSLMIRPGFLSPNNRQPAFQANTKNMAAKSSQAAGQLIVAYHQSPAEIAQIERVNPQKRQGKPVTAKNGHSNMISRLMGTKKVSNSGIPVTNIRARWFLIISGPYLPCGCEVKVVLDVSSVIRSLVSFLCLLVRQKFLDKQSPECNPEWGW